MAHKVSVSEAVKARNDVFNQRTRDALMIVVNLVENKTTRFYSQPGSLVSLATLGWIRSLSTALPIHAGLQGIRFDHTFGLTTKKPKGPYIYFDASSEECQIALEDCKHNISVMRSWSNLKEKDFK